MLNFSFLSNGKSKRAARNEKKRSRSASGKRRPSPFRVEELEARVVPALVVDPLNPRYLMDSTTGKVVYLAGASTWNNQQAIANSPFGGYSNYINYLQSNGNNFFRLWVFESSKTSLPIANFAMEAVTPTIYARSTTPGANDGGNKFDLNIFNQAFFDQMRQDVITAGNSGIYVAVTLFNGWSVQRKGSYQDPWPFHYYNQANNINGINGDPNNLGNGSLTDTLSIPAITALREAYVRKVIDTLHDLPNVVYEIANEVDGGAAETAWQNHFVDYVHSYEQSTYGTRQPVLDSVEYPYYGATGQVNADLFASNAEMIAPANAAASPYDYQFHPPPSTGAKVIVGDTDHLGSHTYSDAKFVWRNFAMGEYSLYMDTYNNSYFSVAHSLQLVKNMGYAVAYANRMNLAADTPQPGLSSTGYCLADASATTPEYWVYLPSGGSATVDLSATTQTMDVEWFDPNTDTTKLAGTITGGASRSFTSPFGGSDAVLFLSMPATVSIASVPSNVAASAGNAQVTLSWAASTGATSYDIYRSTTSGGEGSTPYKTGLTATSFTDTGLTNGATYYYEVTAVNSAGQSGVSSEVSATPQVPVAGAPANLTASSGNAQVILNWTASTGAASYDIFRSTTSGGEGSTPFMTGVTATTFTNTGLTNGTTYFYQVTAVNAAGQSSKSTEASATPQVNLPATPANLTAAGGNAQVSLSWTASSGAVSYDIYRSTTSGGEGSTPFMTGVTATTFTDTGLAAGTTYYYQITAVNAAGQSGKSTEASATTQVPLPGAPANLAATGGNAQVSLSWTASTGAASYDIYRSTTSGGEGSTPFKTGVTGTTFTDTGLTNGTTYFYQVTAVNAAGQSSKSGEASATPQPALPGTPANLTATFGNAQVSLSWTASTGAASYDIYRSTISGGEGSTPYKTGVTATTFTDTGLTNGTTYYYEVTAANSAGQSGVSSEASATPQVPVPGAPTNLTATSGNAQVILSWTASTGAASYDIYRSTTSGGEGSTPFMTGVTATTFTDTGLTNGTTYFYQVTAVDAAGQSSKSTEASATPLVGLPATPTNLMAAGGNAQVSLGWSASNGAVSYDIYRSTTSGGEGSTPFMTGVTATTFTDTGIAAGTTYYYQVTAVNAAGQSSKSSEASATTQVALPGTPANPTATSGNAQVSLSWAASSGAVSYDIYRSTTSGGEGSTPFMTGVTATTFTDTGLAAGTTYFYQVTAVNVAGQSGKSTEASATTQVALPGAPANLTATGGNAQVSLSWSASIGAVSYDIYRSTTSGGEGSTPFMTGVTATTFTDTGLAAGTTYYYQVSAVNAAGQSSKSTEASATTQVALPGAPASLTATGGNAQVSLRWSASNGAVSYDIYRSTTSGGEGSTPFMTGVTATTFIDTGLAAGTTYYYQVSAVNAAGQSSKSTEASATTQVSLPATPANLTATGGNAQVSVSWGASNGAVSYDIYRSTTSGGEGSTPFKTGVTGTSFTDTGLTNGTTYFYQVTAVDAAGQSSKSAEASATPHATLPGAPASLTASAGNANVDLTWSASSGAVSYNIYRSTTSGGEGSTPFQTGVTVTSFTDQSVVNGTTYYYRVTAVAAAGESGTSMETSATPLDPTYTPVTAIDAGGGAAGAFAADKDWTQNVPDTGSTTHAIDTSGVINPAPQSVYQSWRSGTFYYQIPGFTAGGSYLVRLHFAEDWVSKAGQRVFNVSINGKQVLTHFDIIAATGAEFKAIVKEFTVNANDDGKIIVFVQTVVGNGRLNGIEILSAVPEMLAGTPAGRSDAPELTQAQLNQVVVQAIQDWAALGLSPEQIARLNSARFVIADLPGSTLSETAGNEILIDRDAAGYGWSIGAVPAATEVDLLTAVCHELGHLIGLNDIPTQSNPGDVMDNTLGLGTRRLPSPFDFLEAKSLV
jgi:fibronectin type 3 domain-containing protein